MIKILLKKQLFEIFKAYFFDMKKNKARSKAATIGFFVLFGILLLVIMGSFFGVISFALCPIVTLGYGWLYYAIIGLISVLLGIFGSVFSTYSGLYLAKDNDLLLSMPVPVKAIMVSRLLGVYLMGLLYSAIALIPAIVVRFIFVGISAGEAVGAVIFIVLISLFVLVLSCVLGYVVAKISLKLKNKSFITVILALAFLALYYYFYFNANTFLSGLIGNIGVYGAAIKSKAYPVYLIGRAAEGDLLPIIAVSAVVLLLLFVTLFVISRSFIKIATSTSAVAKVKYKQKKLTEKSQSGALLSREFKRFTSSANYMLNCGLGAVLLPAAAVFLFLKGADIRILINDALSSFKDMVYVAVAVMVELLVSMNDIATPSVSLEGKTLCQLRSLPIDTKKVLKAKLLLQIYVCMVPTIIFVSSAVFALRPDVITAVFTVLLSAVIVVFYAVFDLYCGLHKVNLAWTNEVVP
ncbi:MAG: hypothetical protein J5662_08235, partial [Clostridia bacterium]|nr:hypothetical protein [Clostridia bacterium]